MRQQDLSAVTRHGIVRTWWYLHPAVTGEMWAVLCALATYADAAGYCVPSQATLARHLKMSRPRVNRIIADLCAIELDDGRPLLEKVARRRPNGGTTSCEYRLRLDPPGVVSETGPVPPPDTPCHGWDRNQTRSEQIQDSHCGARARVRSHASIGEASGCLAGAGGGNAGAADMLPRDWRPSPEVQIEARRLYPDVDLEEHAALFVARCRSRGYPVSLATADDMWLSWLIADERRVRQEAAAAAPRQTRSSAPPKGAAHLDRFAAWAAAAHGGPVSRGPA